MRRTSSRTSGTAGGASGTGGPGSARAAAAAVRQDGIQRAAMGDARAPQVFFNDYPIKYLLFTILMAIMLGVLAVLVPVRLMREPVLGCSLDVERGGSVCDGRLFVGTDRGSGAVNVAPGSDRDPHLLFHTQTHGSQWGVFARNTSVAFRWRAEDDDAWEDVAFLGTGAKGVTGTGVRLGGARDALQRVGGNVASVPGSLLEEGLVIVDNRSETRAPLTPLTQFSGIGMHSPDGTKLGAINPARYLSPGGTTHSLMVISSFPAPGGSADPTRATYLSVADNGVHIGSTPKAASHTVEVDGIVVAGDFNKISDARRKNVTGPITPQQGMDTIAALRPVRFAFKDDPPSAPLRAGLIAQEVLGVAPYAVSVPDDLATGTFGVDYTELVADVVAALQHLHGRVVDTERVLAALRDKKTGK